MATAEEYARSVLEIAASIFDAPELKDADINAKLTSLGIDSLDFVELVFSVEERWGVEIEALDDDACALTIGRAVAKLRQDHVEA